MAPMRQEIRVVAFPSETTEFTDELQTLLDEIGRTTGFSTLTAQYSPPFDVFETDDAIQLVMDLPGIDPASIRIAAKGQTLLIAGEKRPRRAVGDSSFHLVER